MTREEVELMGRLDDAADKSGGYVKWPPSDMSKEPYLIIRGYCKKNGKKKEDLTATDYRKMGIRKV